MKETPTVQARGRKVGRYQPRVQRVHASPDEFMSSNPGEGIHTIRIGAAIADVLYDERGDGPLLVTFPSALTPDATWPFFSGIGVAARLGASLLAFSDPSTGMAGVPTGWTLGDHRVPFHEHVPRIIDLLARGRRVVMLGLSAGGYAALHYSSAVPESVAVVGNPRTHLLAPPTAVQYWARTLYDTDDPARISEIVPTAPAPSTNRVIYLQNSGDHPYFAAHMVPYLMRLRSDADVWTLIDHWGDGHVPPPRELLHDVLSAVLEDPAAVDGITRFTSVDAVMQQQAALNFARHLR